MNIILLSILVMFAIVIIPNVYADSLPISTNISITNTDPIYQGDRITFKFVVNSQQSFDSKIVWDDGLTTIGKFSTSQGSAGITRSHTYDRPGEYTVTHTVSYFDTHPHTETYTDTLIITVLERNTAPITSDHAFDVNQGATTSLNIDNLYSDETPNRELTLSIDVPPTHGTAELLTDNTILSYTHTADNLTPDTIIISVSDGEFSSDIVLTINFLALPTESTHDITIDTITSSLGDNIADFTSNIISEDHENLAWSISGLDPLNVVFGITTDGELRYVLAQCSNRGTYTFIATAVADNFTYTFNVSLVMALDDVCSTPPIINISHIVMDILLSDVDMYTMDNPYEIDISSAFDDPNWNRFGLTGLTLVASSGVGSLEASDTNDILYYTLPIAEIFFDSFTITVTNPAGAASTFGVTITFSESPVLDTTPPFITIFRDLTTPKAATSPNGANISFAGVTAFDSIDGVTAVVCTLDGEIVSGFHVLPIGTHNVECTSEDSATPPNSSLVTFTITITDYVQSIIPPAVELPEFITYSFEESITNSGDIPFNNLRGIATDFNGRIIVADALNNRILIYSPNGILVDTLPNNLSSQVTLLNPQGIRVNSANIIFVADTVNNRILIFSSNGFLSSIIVDADGVGGAFNSPQDIAFDSLGRILVTDSGNNSIRIFDFDHTFVKSISLDDIAGESSFPRQIVVDSTNRIIVTTPSSNNIHVLDANGMLSFTISGPGGGGGSFNAPSGVTIDSNDRIIVADTGNNKIQIFESDGTYVESLTGGSLSSPYGVTVDNSNRILVTDSGNNRIQIYNFFSGFSPSLLEYIPVYAVVASGDMVHLSSTTYEIPTQNDGVPLLINNHADGTALFTPETVAISSGNIDILITDVSEDITPPILPARSTVQFLLEFGDESESITFTKPVKITLNAQSGNIPFWYAPLQEIPDHQIIPHCTTNNFDFRNVELSNTNECYYNEDGDIVIWTNHFTIFGTFSENAPTISKKSGGGSDDWKKKPTFGKSFENLNAQLVSDGFIFNGYTLNIIDNWHTDFIKTSSIIGETNHVEMKVYTDRILSTMTLSLGIPEVGKKSDAETSIHVTLNRNYTDPNGYNIVDITHEQKEDLIYEDKTKASITPSLCTPRDNIQRCYTLSLDFVVMAPLKADVLAISAMDIQRRSTTTFVNEGVEFTGESLLDPHTYNIHQKHSSQDPMEILILTQQDRRYNIWEDNNGYLWERNDYGSYKQITFAEFERNQDKYNSVMTRLHSNYNQLIIDEQEKAMLIWDGTKVLSVLSETFAYDIPIPMDKLLDPFVIENMKIEEQKAMDRYYTLPQFYEVGNLK